jgi:hypothetical protein
LKVAGLLENGGSSPRCNQNRPLGNGEVFFRTSSSASTEQKSKMAASRGPSYDTLISLRKFGDGEGIRTLDPNLGKAVHRVPVVGLIRSHTPENFPVPVCSAIVRRPASALGVSADARSSASIASGSRDRLSHPAMTPLPFSAGASNPSRSHHPVRALSATRCRKASGQVTGRVPADDPGCDIATQCRQRVAVAEADRRVGRPNREEHGAGRTGARQRRGSGEQRDLRRGMRSDAGLQPGLSRQCRFQQRRQTRQVRRPRGFRRSGCPAPRRWLCAPGAACAVHQAVKAAGPRYKGKVSAAGTARPNGFPAPRRADGGSCGRAQGRWRRSGRPLPLSIFLMRFGAWTGISTGWLGAW